MLTKATKAGGVRRTSSCIGTGAWFDRPYFDIEWGCPGLSIAIDGCNDPATPRDWTCAFRPLCHYCWMLRLAIPRMWSRTIAVQQSATNGSAGGVASVAQHTCALPRRTPNRRCPMGSCARVCCSRRPATVFSSKRLYVLAKNAQNRAVSTALISLHCARGENVHRKESQKCRRNDACSARHIMILSWAIPVCSITSSL